MKTEQRALLGRKALRRPAGVLAVLAIIAAFAPPGTATAGSPTLTVEGTPLAGSVMPGGEFTVTAGAPAGVTVKFKIDGTYLGQDSSAPYTWPISTSAGTHKIEARWDLAGRQTVAAEFQVAAQAAPPAPSPQPTPVPAPPAGQAGTVTVSSAAGLAAALAAAAPGQTIRLEDGLYVGKFVASVSGTAAAPITLSGSRAAVLSTGSTGSGYGLHVKGSHWRISGLTVSNAAKGIVLDGSTHTVISNVDVGNVGDEAVHFRRNSSDSTLRDSEIHDTGLVQPGYGEGVYIGSANGNWASVMGSSTTPDRSDRIQVLNNRISRTPAEGIDAKEGTSAGVIRGNTFDDAGSSGSNFADSWADIKGNGYLVDGNAGTTTRRDAFQVHSALQGWGMNNKFSGNTVLGGVPGYEVWVQSGSLGNVIVCKESKAGLGLSNVPCSS